MRDREEAAWWGDGVPLSEARLAVVERLEGGLESSGYVVVYASVSPRTFAWARQHRERFADRPDVLRLLDAAQDRGERMGWVAQAFLEEFGDDPEGVIRRARKALGKAKAAVMAMQRGEMEGR